MEKPVKMKGDFTLKIPKDRNGKDFYYIGINDIDDATYTMASKLILEQKEQEAAMFMLEALCVDGKEHLDDIRGSFIAKRSAATALTELISPIDVELKKN